MSLKTFFAKLYASRASKKIESWASKPEETQKKVFEDLISQAAETEFGKDHGFPNIKTYQDFQLNVPIRDYEGHRKYVEKITDGESNITWPGRPIYFCKTSGTTSGTKYIPISKESISNHINGARNALLSYIAETDNANFINGKMIFLQGSPELEYKNGIPIGRLSGIVAHHVPRYLQKNRKPSFRTNCIEDWETKVDAVVDETISEDMTLISGIPPWIQMYFEKIIDKSGKKTIKETFKNFSLFVYGGVNFEPYRHVFKRLIGKEIDTLEVYPASEGFLAFQNSQRDNGLLLILNDGIFYEFIPAEDIGKDKPRRLTISEVELDKNYAIILSTNAGLWAYDIGDMVKFTSLNPYKIRVSGRTKHYTSAFGEHVISEEVELAIQEALKKLPAEVINFHVAPQVNPEEGLPYHEWFIEFSSPPQDISQFSIEIDTALRQKNSYYNDLIIGNMLKPLVIRTLRPNAFNDYMKSIGKLGGQNKPPRLANDRKMAVKLSQFVA